MGLPMAHNLEKFLQSEGLPPLTLWNRSPSKLPPASKTLAHADSLKDLAKDCDVVLTSLAHDEAAREVYKELFEGAKASDGTIFVDTSTLYPTTCGASSPPLPHLAPPLGADAPLHTGELEREASKISHTSYLCSPVFGPCVSSLSSLHARARR